MLGFFPRLAEDELLYSGIARLNRRFGQISTLRFSRLLFGTSYQSVFALFQQNVDAFVDHLPPNSWTSEALIWKHMMAPYFSPFVESESLDLALQKIRRGESGGPWRLSWTKNAVSGSTLRCCKLCFAEDVAEIGEGTWKRVHQCPPALACPVHGVSLCETGVPLSCRNRRRGKWVALSKGILEQAEPIASSAPLEVRVDLARRCQWLLKNELPPQSRLWLSQQYRTLTRQGGWIADGDRLDWTAIGRELIEQYGSEFLNRFGVDPRKRPRQNWIKAIASDNSRGSSPLRHLILISFFGPTMSHFFSGDLTGPSLRQSDTRTKPDPCKNPFCRRFNAEAVPSGIIGKTLIECPECGFSYRFTAGGKYRSRIEAVGELWISRILALRESGTTWNAIASAAQLPIAAFYELKSRFQHELVREGIEAQAKRVIRRRRKEGKRDECRAWLIAERKKHPGAKRKDLASSGSAQYSWLQEHDKSWFEEHAPPVQQLDWEQRDMELEEEVRRVAADLLDMDPPIRISKTQLIERSKNGWCLEKRKSLVPKALKALESLAESRADYRKRIA